MEYSSLNLTIARDIMSWKEFAEGLFKTHRTFIDADSQQRFVRLNEEPILTVAGREFKPATSMEHAFEVLQKMSEFPEVTITMVSSGGKVAVTLHNSTTSKDHLSTRAIPELALAICEVVILNLGKSLKR